MLTQVKLLPELFQQTKETPFVDTSIVDVVPVVVVVGVDVAAVVCIAIAICFAVAAAAAAAVPIGKN